MPAPTLFLLPAVGAGARAWDSVIAALDEAAELVGVGVGVDVVALDPPDVGVAASPLATVQQRAAWVAEQVRLREPDEWLIVGAGDGGRAAAVVASWAEAGERGLIAAAGLVLVGGSAVGPGGHDRGDEPPAPEVLRTPVAVLEGEGDADLGAADIARLVVGFVQQVTGRAVVPPAFARLIASDRVAARTRRVMLARLAEPGDAPGALSPAQRRLLAVLLARVVPQRGTDLDLAGRLDRELAAGPGDGWRFAELPPDTEAWRRGLDTIAAALPGFGALDGTEQDAAIDRIAAGGIGSDDEALLTGARMALWLQDVQAAAVRAWLSHPATQAWIRYDGFADGGDGPRKQGFATTHAGEWEAWQRDWRTGKELQA